jgi:hypothetical protein
MKTLNDYVMELEHYGIAAHNAARIVCDFRRELSENDLEIYIQSLEEDLSCGFPTTLTQYQTE